VAVKPPGPVDTDEEAAPAPEKEPENHGVLGFLKELPVLIVLAFVLALLIKTFLVQAFYIPSASMENTLQGGGAFAGSEKTGDHPYDRVLVNKLVYDFRDPHRGEIIVFKAPALWQHGEEGEDFIKRIIGVPGDNVVCCDPQHRLTINGVSLDEPYIYRNADGTQDPAADTDFNITVPAGRLWVMGDHRSASGDSLENYKDTNNNIQESTIPEDAVIGRAFTIFWPVSRARWLSVPDSFDNIPDAAPAK
jgi:signal peptidase I